MALRRLFRVVNGGTPTSDESNWDGDVLWATPADLAVVDGGKINSTARTLTRDGLSSGSSAAPAGSIVLSTRAPIGYVAETTTETAFNQGCRGLVPRAEMDLRFFRYQLLARRTDLVALGQGSTFTELSSDALATFKVACPPLSDQFRIADLLDAETARIDALIERKRRMVGLLNERFTSHVTATLEAVTRRVPLRHFARWREGPGILALDFRDTGTPLIRLINLVEDTIKLDGCGYLDPDDVAARWWHLRVRKGELLVSGSAASGLPVVVPPEAEGAVPYTGLIRMWPNSEALNKEFLRLFLGSNVFLDQVDQLKTGVAIQHWGPSHLGQVSMPLPERAAQDEIAGRLLAERVLVRETVSKVQRQIDLLREHRQALINAAVIGELDAAKATA